MAILQTFNKPGGARRISTPMHTTLPRKVQQNFVLPVEGTMDIKILDQLLIIFIDDFCNIIEMGVEKGIHFNNCG
ncbi:hypothetical protein T06_1483 [Trichinella sp. T6]|nr:hypothetical protein T06_1483 [Trichinella sp. T6]